MEVSTGHCRSLNIVDHAYTVTQLHGATSKKENNEWKIPLFNYTVKATVHSKSKLDISICVNHNQSSPVVSETCIKLDTAYEPNI